MPNVSFGEDILNRMVRAVEKVRERLKRATSALERLHIPYAVIGGNAVAAWVATIDEAAVRNTQDVDIALRRGDLEAAKVALAEEGFIYRHSSGIDMFLDGEGAKARDAVHAVFSGEKVRPEYLLPVPDVDENDRPGEYRVLALEALVRMKLTSFRDKDRTHLRDFLDVGLIDESWPSRFPSLLGERLQQLLDTPDG